MRSNAGIPSTVGGLLAILLWSTTFAFARSLAEQVGPLTAGAAVYLTGGCLCLIKVACSTRPIARMLELRPAYLLGCGGLFLFYTAAVYLAVGFAKDREQLLEIALLNYLWPALTILFSVLLLNKHGSVWLIPGTALATSGVFLVMIQGTRISWGAWLNHLRNNPAAYALALGAAIAWALYSNLARRWSAANSDGAVELFILATGLVLLALRSMSGEKSAWTPRALAEALGLAVITAAAYTFWEAAMRSGNLLLVAACSYFTPLLSTVVSCLYLGVSPGPRLWIGCLFLVCGSLLTWCSISDEPTSAPNPSNR